MTALVITESLAARSRSTCAGSRPSGSTPVAEGAAGAAGRAARRLPRALRLDRRRLADRGDGRARAGLGHDYVVLTDHSPRLTVARGLSPERLREQLDVVAELNEELAPFRILTGIECDINEDGSLDQEPALLAQLDLVVAVGALQAADAREEMTAADGRRDQQPAHRRARPLHRPAW